jgi:hypothetical protein
MLVVKGNYGGLYDADMLVALDARTGREAGRLEFPLTRGMGRIPFGRLLSLAACDREGRWVALLTPSDVRILTMPGLDVLSTQPFDLEAEQQARQSGRPIPVFRLPIGLVADDAGASLYGVTYPLNAAQPFAAPDPGTTPPRLDETVFGFDLALPAGSPLRALAGGAVTGVAFDPRARFLFAAGEERLVRALDSGTAAPAWASGFAGQGDLNYQARLDPTGQVLIVVLPAARNAAACPVPTAGSWPCRRRTRPRPAGGAGGSWMWPQTAGGSRPRRTSRPACRWAAPAASSSPPTAAISSSPGGTPAVRTLCRPGPRIRSLWPAP